MRRDDLRRGQRAGHGDHAELAGAANHAVIDIGRDDQARARVTGGLNLLHGQRRSAADEHAVAVFFHRMADFFGVFLHAVRAVVVKREFQHANAARNQRFHHAVELFRRHMAQNGDELRRLDPRQRFMM